MSPCLLKSFSKSFMLTPQLLVGRMPKTMLENFLMKPRLKICCGLDLDSDTWRREQVVSIPFCPNPIGNTESVSNDILCQNTACGIAYQIRRRPAPKVIQLQVENLTMMMKWLISCFMNDLKFGEAFTHAHIVQIIGVLINRTAAQLSLDWTISMPITGD